MPSSKNNGELPMRTSTDAGAVVVSAAGGGGGPPTASRFKAGKSGNPGGRPKTLPTFRVRCRNVSFALLAEIKARLAHKDPETGLASIPLPDLVDALARVAPFGGFLPADRQAVEELARLRVALSLLASSSLTPEQRKVLIGQVRPEQVPAKPDPP
jgi:hypothetical protein